MIGAFRGQGGEVVAVMSSSPERAREPMRATHGIAHATTEPRRTGRPRRHRRGLYLDHQRTAPRSAARRRRRRQACAVREAAGADPRRRAQHGRGVPGARRRHGHQPPSAQRRHASGDARRDPATGASASRCSRACSTPSICRRICRAGASTSRRPAAASCSTSPCHDADTLALRARRRARRRQRDDVARRHGTRRAWRTA